MTWIVPAVWIAPNGGVKASDLSQAGPGIKSLPDISTPTLNRNTSRKGADDPKQYYKIFQPTQSAYVLSKVIS
jgi:hypothetical protein